MLVLVLVLVMSFECYSMVFIYFLFGVSMESFLSTIERLMRTLDLASILRQSETFLCSLFFQMNQAQHSTAEHIHSPNTHIQTCFLPVLMVLAFPGFSCSIIIFKHRNNYMLNVCYTLWLLLLFLQYFFFSSLLVVSIM